MFHNSLKSKQAGDTTSTMSNVSPSPRNQVLSGTAYALAALTTATLGSVHTVHAATGETDSMATCVSTATVMFATAAYFGKNAYSVLRPLLFSQRADYKDVGSMAALVDKSTPAYDTIRMAQ